MYRKLTLFALALAVTTTAGAQSTEVIIRRSGQKDQVIRLDDKQAKEMAAKMSGDLATALKDLKEVQLAHEGSLFSLKLDSTRMAVDAKLLAKQSAELANRVSAMKLAQPEMMARVVREAMTQPRIGIYVDNSASQDSDKFGALVASVSPGGPADKAGIRSGDIITRIDGKSLASTGAKDEALPGVRLIEIVTKLAVGKPVTVEYRRGTTNNTTKVTPVEEEDIATFTLAPSLILRGDSLRMSTHAAPAIAGRGTMLQRVPMPTVPDGEGINVFRSMPGGNFSVAFSSGGPLSNLEVVSLNEKLGSYFGTSDGVLVVNIGEKDAFGLVPGDVIVSVDGRKVTTSSQLMRILRTYDKGEEFKIQIMRQKKAETLSGKLP